MAHRTFIDGNGREWQAWDVSADALRALEDRREAERRTRPERLCVPERRAPPDRRYRLDRRPGARFVVAGELAKGWLAFGCGARRRRLAPAPQDWESLPDAELARLCARARPAPLRRTWFQRARSARKP